MKKSRKIDLNNALDIINSVSHLAFAGVFVNDDIDKVVKIAKIKS